MRVYASAEMTLTDTNDGISVTGIDRYYMASSSSSGITVGSQGWKPDPQETNPVSRYHWSYEVVNYSDGAKIPSKPAVIGVYGKEGKEGVDAVTVSLSSEAHTFAGTESKAIASSITIDISAFKGNQRIPTRIGTVTGGIDGQLEHSELGGDTTNNKLVINATSSLNKANGMLSIPIEADGRIFNKVFSWSIAFKGKTGDDGTTTYTWVRYADTPTSGMENFPDGKKYIGLAFNQTTQNESNNYEDYQWSLMPQNIEIGGRNLLKGTSDSFKEINPRTRFTSLLESSITPISEYGLKAGDTITFRMYIQAHNSVPANARITYHIVGGGYNTATGNRIQVGGEGYSTATYTIPSNVDRLEVGLDASVPAGDTSIFMYYKEAKLEKGNIATDWTPAPEDVQSQIDDKAESEAFNQLIQTVSTESERLDSINTDVESTKNNFLITHTDEYVNKITTTESTVDGLESRVVSVEETKENVDTFFQFDDAFTIGKSNSQTKLRMTNDEIQFLDGETKGTYITGNTMVSQNIQIQDKLNLPKHTFETEGDITVVKYIG